MTLQINAEVALVNEDLRNSITEVANSSTPAETIAKLDAISLARIRIDSNVRDLMVLEALAVQLRRKTS
jgi:DNA polymerase-3 subunit delta'